MSSRIRAANKRYYSSKGKKIYTDFSTFAQGKALAACNAAEFVRDFSNRPTPVAVCEYGVGKGDFAKNFLDELKKRNKRLYAKTRYYLLDFSEKMLLAARSSLKAHRSVCISGKFDAAVEAPDLPFDYCRINELFTDLPASFYMKKDGLIFEMKPSGKEKFSAEPQQFPPPSISAFLARIDEGRIMPFNFAAEKFLLSLCACGKPGFRADVFDYGFYSAEEVFLHPVDEWNSLMLRNYGGQITHSVRQGASKKAGAAEGYAPHNVTTDLNFPQLLSSLAAAGVPAKIEKQKAYCERVLGCPLGLSETSRGLDYVRLKKKSPIGEDDGFYHLRIGR